jgi:hypothetical protein
MRSMDGYSSRLFSPRAEEPPALVCRFSPCLLAALAAVLIGAALPRDCAAQARWPDEQQAGAFFCHADFSLEAEQGLLAELASLEQDLHASLRAPRPRETVHLFLFQNKNSYQGYMKQYFPRVAYRRALFIKARGPGMVIAYKGEDFHVDVRHESTHALLHAWLPSVPLWLDEGLAEYFEVPKPQRQADNPHLATIRTLVRFGSLPRLEALEDLTKIEDMGRDEYRDAWAWCHFMLHGPREANEELQRYLVDLEGGTEIGLLSARLRRRVPDLDRRVAEHFR